MNSRKHALRLAAIPALFLASTLVGCSGLAELAQAPKDEAKADDAKTGGPAQVPQQEGTPKDEKGPTPTCAPLSLGCLPPPPEPDNRRAPYVVGSLLNLESPRSERVKFSSSRAIPSCNGFETEVEFDAAGVAFVTAKSCQEDYTGQNGAFDVVEKFKVAVPSAIGSIVSSLNAIKAPDVNNDANCSMLPGGIGRGVGGTVYGITHTSSNETKNFSVGSQGCGDFQVEQAEKARTDVIALARAQGERVTP